jgi:hypothetical protein
MTSQKGGRGSQKGEDRRLTAIVHATVTQRGPCDSSACDSSSTQRGRSSSHLRSSICSCGTLHSAAASAFEPPAPGSVRLARGAGAYRERQTQQAGRRFGVSR